MNRTYLKIVFREIKRSVARFLALSGISLLGVGFLVGILASTPDMRISMDKYYDDNKLWDLRVLSTIGLSANEIDIIGKNTNVKQYEGAYLADVMAGVDSGGQKAVRLHSIPEKFNKLTLLEGRMPESDDECVVVQALNYGKNIEVGSTLNIDNHHGSDINKGKLKIVGRVRSPLYISVDRDRTNIGDGSIAEIFYARPGIFTSDVYSEMLVEVDGASELSDFDTEYVNLVDSATDGLKVDVLESIATRQKDLINDASAKILDAGREISTKETEVNAKIADARTKLDASKADLDKSQQDIDTKKAELEKNKADLTEKIDNLKATGGSQGQIASLESSLSRTNAGLEELAVSQKIIDENRAELDKGYADIDVQEKNARSEIDNAKNELNNSKKTLEFLKLPEAIVLNRETIPGHYTYADNMESIASISQVFPVFFFMVAVLVALTTMTRMIDEERTQIGTLDALGYGKAKIISKYLIYSGVASLIGSVGGILIGFKLFPSIIYSTGELTYVLPPLIAPIHFGMGLTVVAVFVGGIILTTVAAGYGILTEVPASLMIAKAPKPGKRIFLEYIPTVWRAMSFTQKVAARNLFRYKRRLFLTIIGISGCTALLVTGFGLHDSISDIVNKQYNEVFDYNLTVGISTDAHTEQSDMSILYDKKYVEEYMGVNATTVTVSANGKSDSTAMVIPENAADFNKFVNLRNRVKNKQIDFNENSVVLSEKMAKILDIKVGDSFDVKIRDKTYSLNLTDIAENYVYTYLFLPTNVYENIIGEQYKTNSVYIRTLDLSEQDKNTYMEELMKSEFVASAIFSDDIVTKFQDMLSRIDTIVVVITVCAGLLAFVVLYTLININIAERKKELATIKVLGFYDRECATYVYRETAVLTVIGALIGLVLGVLLHAFVVVSSEPAFIMFGRDIKPLSYVFSFIVTIIFSIFVNLVMYRKIRSVNMVESLKEE